MIEGRGFDVVAMVHLVVLALWGGVVATEAVIEILPFRRRELHSATIRFHYWISLSTRSHHFTWSRSALGAPPLRSTSSASWSS
ncbi:MAG: hypothetical protein P8127_09325 [Acidobacteriota bacterium]